jgi:hypothetical protein
MPLETVSRSPRVPFARTVRVTPLDSSGSAARLLAGNLSREGMFVLSRDPLPSGAKVTLSLEAQGQAFPFVEGEVVWSRPSSEGPGAAPGFGLRFTNFLHPRAHLLVEHLISSLTSPPQPPPLPRISKGLEEDLPTESGRDTAPPPAWARTTGRASPEWAQSLPDIDENDQTLRSGPSWAESDALAKLPEVDVDEAAKTLRSGPSWADAPPATGEGILSKAWSEAATKPELPSHKKKANEALPEAPRPTWANATEPELSSRPRAEIEPTPSSLVRAGKPVGPGALTSPELPSGKGFTAPIEATPSGVISTVLGKDSSPSRVMKAISLPKIDAPPSGTWARGAESLPLDATPSQIARAAGKPMVETSPRAVPEEELGVRSSTLRGPWGAHVPVHAFDDTAISIRPPKMLDAAFEDTLIRQTPRVDDEPGSGMVFKGDAKRDWSLSGVPEAGSRLGDGPVPPTGGLMPITSLGVDPKTLVKAPDEAAVSWMDDPPLASPEEVKQARAPWVGLATPPEDWVKPESPWSDPEVVLVDSDVELVTAESEIPEPPTLTTKGPWSDGTTPPTPVPATAKPEKKSDYDWWGALELKPGEPEVSPENPLPFAPEKSGELPWPSSAEKKKALGAELVTPQIKAKRLGVAQPIEPVEAERPGGEFEDLSVLKRDSSTWLVIAGVAAAAVLVAVGYWWVARATMVEETELAAPVEVMPAELEVGASPEEAQSPVAAAPALNTPGESAAAANAPPTPERAPQDSAPPAAPTPGAAPAKNAAPAPAPGASKAPSPSALTPRLAAVTADGAPAPRGPPAVPVAISSGAISSLHIRPGQRSVEVEVRPISGATIRHGFVLLAPPRLVIDVDGPAPERSAVAELEGTKPILRARTGATSSGTRVVLDLGANPRRLLRVGSTFQLTTGAAR